MMKSSSRIQHHRRYGSPTSVGLAHLGIVRVFGRDHHPLRVEPHVASQNQRHKPNRKCSLRASFALLWGLTPSGSQLPGCEA
jgi:hypothetical protein